MKTFIRFVCWIAVALLTAYVLIVLAPTWMRRLNLRLDGYTKEEVRLFETIDYQQSMVDIATGKGKTKVENWGHLTEVYDTDGNTLLGYSVDAELPAPYISKRYYFTRDKRLLWWGNISDTIDDEGREHLRSGKGHRP